MAVAEGRADSPFRRVARKVDRHARLLRAWPLPGGVSAQVTALEIGLPFLRDQQQVFGSRLAECPDRLDDALSEGSIRAALARAWPPSRAFVAQALARLPG